MKKKIFIGAIISSLILITAAGGLFLLRRDAIVAAIVEKALLKAGKPLKFGEYTVFIERIEGKKLFGIKISSENGRLEAKSGDYEYIPAMKAVKLNLTDGVAEDRDPQMPGGYHLLTFKQSHITINLDSILKESRGSR